MPIAFKNINELRELHKSNPRSLAIVNQAENDFNTFFDYIINNNLFRNPPIGRDMGKLLDLYRDIEISTAEFVSYFQNNMNIELGKFPLNPKARLLFPLLAIQFYYESIYSIFNQITNVKKLRELLNLPKCREINAGYFYQAYKKILTNSPISKKFFNNKVRNAFMHFTFEFYKNSENPIEMGIFLYDLKPESLYLEKVETIPLVSKNVGDINEFSLLTFYNDFNNIYVVFNYVLKKRLTEIKNKSNFIFSSRKNTLLL